MSCLKLDRRVEELGSTVEEALLTEHRCYVKPLMALLESGKISGLAHITGGGLTDNLPRILPTGTAARIHRGSWPVPGLFRVLQSEGGVADDEMHRTFNMGIGMVIVVRPGLLGEIQEHLEGQGESYHRIGEVVSGDRKVHYA